MAAALTLVVAALGGCAASQEAQAPSRAGGWAIEPIERDPTPHAPALGGAWVAYTSGVSTDESLAARRNSALIGRPPAPLVDASVWPGRPVPTETRRIPTIFSRWGTTY